jgi:ribonuclease Z
MQPLLWPLAWRFDWEGGSVCFTGDTAPCEDVTELARGAHTVVASTPEQSDEMHEDIATCIYNVAGAAELARDAGVGRLVLAHLTAAPVRNRESTIAEVRTVYDGELVIADEGMQLSV